MKVMHISDTHTKHVYLTELIENSNVDLLIHSGDASNNKVPAINANELHDFLDWYDSLDCIPNKIYVPGNHDTSLEAGLINKELYSNIIFLINESVNVDGVNIYGSPITPTFGHNWAYNLARHKTFSAWERIPENTDILVTHGPPKGVLDTTSHFNLEAVGCKNLLNKVRKIQPKYHLFGHLHDEPDNLNYGMRTISGIDTVFMNSSIVNLRHEVVNSPQIFNI